MPRELYNEGRVVGYSSYELYVKHALSENPDEEVASEREWLAAQLGNGSSMILKILPNNNTGVYSIDVPLPENSKLCAANVITGSQFFGDCICDATSNKYCQWATVVKDYGQGISNTSQSSPSTSETGVTDGTTYPKQSIKEFDDTQKKQFLQYLKIQDAVVLQPGTWKAAQTKDSDNKPWVDLTPNLYKYPVIRITFASQITTSFYILFTRFTNRTILQGISGLDSGSTEKLKPENGDFLGPEIFPWANKVVFIHPPIASYYLRKYLASGHENRKDINNTDAGTDRVNNLKIEHDEDSIDTILTSSYLYSQDGISIVGPTTEGGNIEISSKVHSANNYVKVEQSHSDKQHLTDATELTHSLVIPGNGVAIHGPTTPGGDINVSSIIKSDNNMMKVTQNASTKKNDTTTVLKVSEIKGSDGIAVTSPDNPGGDVKLTVKINSGDTKYLKIVQSNGVTTITPVKLSPITNEYTKSELITITQPDIANGKDSAYIDINWKNLIKALKADKDLKDYIGGLVFPHIHAIWRAINTILGKFPGNTNLSAGTPTSDTNTKQAPNYNGIIQFNDPSNGNNKIAMGTLNVYSKKNSTRDIWIRTHSNAEMGDLDVRGNE